MNNKERALEKWHLEEHPHLPRTGSDATVGFEAGWDACAESQAEVVKELKEAINILTQNFDPEQVSNMLGKDFSKKHGLDV